MTGCTGEFTIPAAWEDKTQHVWYIVNAPATRTRRRASSSPATNQVELEWKTLQGEQADVNSGFTPNLAASGAGGNGRMGYTDVGDYLRFDKMNMVGIDSVTFRTSGTCRRPDRDPRGLPDRPAGRDRPGHRLRRLGAVPRPGPGRGHRSGWHA